MRIKLIFVLKTTEADNIDLALPRLPNDRWSFAHGRRYVDCRKARHVFARGAGGLPYRLMPTYLSLALSLDPATEDPAHAKHYQGT